LDVNIPPQYNPYKAEPCKRRNKEPVGTEFVYSGRNNIVTRGGVTSSFTSNMAIKMKSGFRDLAAGRL